MCENMKIEVLYPDDLTDDEKKELDEEIRLRSIYYFHRIAAFRARRAQRKSEDVQPDGPPIDRGVRSQHIVSLLTVSGILLSGFECLTV